MKLLLDSCVWRGAQGEVVAEGHDVQHVGELGPDPGDEEVLALAHRENRILVTLDKDFGELAVIKELPHSGIIRLVDISARLQGAAIINALNFHGQELAKGAIVTVESRRIRLRPAP